MKRFFGAVFVTLLMVAGSVKAFAEESAKFNVATYNLRQLNDGDRKKGDGWERRCPVVASVIRFHDFHIFGTQEGFKSQLEDLKAQLPGYEYTGVA
ncbi:MAG: endonuclease, partial [Muribaculaceae bacterium]|nr:endonuclease [Muribaculaceae bacterium]